MTPRPASGSRIEVHNLTKRFGDFTAVEELDFAVEPGRITGFLGPAVLAAVTTLTGSQRLGMATIGVFLGLGALMLLSVRAPRRARG